MIPRGVYTLLGFIASAVLWSRGDEMNPGGVYTLVGFIVSAVLSS